MSEFSPRFKDIVNRALQVVPRHRLYNIGATSLAILAGGCAQPVSAPGLSEGTPSQDGSTTMWEERWTATYRDPVSGEKEDIYYGNVLEVKPSEGTCPPEFTVVAGAPDWQLEPDTCEDYAAIPINVDLSSLSDH